jgi:quercetin dioxygenase-like cupin family protein
MTPEPADPPITRQLVLEAHFPQALPVGRVEVRRIRMAAGHPAGLHVHNGPVVGSIVSGSVAFALDGESTSELVAGDVFYEPGGVRIARFDAGPEGVEFLAYFPLSPGQEPEITHLDN